MYRITQLHAAVHMDVRQYSDIQLADIPACVYANACTEREQRLCMLRVQILVLTSLYRPNSPGVFGERSCCGHWHVCGYMG